MQSLSYRCALLLELINSRVGGGGAAFKIVFKARIYHLLQTITEGSRGEGRGGVAKRGIVGSLGSRESARFSQQY